MLRHLSEQVFKVIVWPQAVCLCGFRNAVDDCTGSSTGNCIEHYPALLPDAETPDRLFHLLSLYENIGERDPRKVRNCQKMVGGFRKESGNEMYCAILSIIESLKRRNMAILENIRRLFMGTPAIFLQVLNPSVQPEGRTVTGF